MEVLVAFVAGAIGGVLLYAVIKKLNQFFSGDIKQ